MVGLLVLIGPPESHFENHGRLKSHPLFYLTRALFTHNG